MVDTPPSRPARGVFRRLALTLGLLSVGLLVGLEVVARWLHLDARQGQAIQMPQSFPQWRQHAGADFETFTGVDYPPRGFVLGKDGYTSAFGPCDFHHEGPTLLALGDSTTVETTGEGSGDFDPTWPKMVGAALGPQWQVCVIAEVGYHPTDLQAMWSLVRKQLHPTVAVLLLCDNDLVGQRPRYPMRVGDAWALFDEPSTVTQWTGLRIPALFKTSEAWRFLSWRIAEAAGQGERLEREVIHRPASEAIIELDADLDLHLYHLPPLTNGWARDPLVDALAKDGGVPITEVALPPDASPYRRDGQDTVHMSGSGHVLVAAQVAADLARQGAPSGP